MTPKKLTFSLCAGEMRASTSSGTSRPAGELQRASHPQQIIPARAVACDCSRTAAQSPSARLWMSGGRRGVRRCRRFEVDGDVTFGAAEGHCCAALGVVRGLVRDGAVAARDLGLVEGGVGMTVAEGMWKGRPVIGSAGVISRRWGHRVIASLRGNFERLARTTEQNRNAR